MSTQAMGITSIPFALVPRRAGEDVSLRPVEVESEGPWQVFVCRRLVGRPTPPRTTTALSTNRCETRCTTVEGVGAAPDLLPKREDLRDE